MSLVAKVAGTAIVKEIQVELSGECEELVWVVGPWSTPQLVFIPSSQSIDEHGKL